MQTGFEEVDQYEGGSIFGEKPDASPFHLQQMTSGFRDGLEGVRKIPAVKDFTLGEFPERLLILSKEYGWIPSEGRLRLRGS